MMMKYTIVKSNDSWKAIFHLYPVTHDDGLQKAHSEEWVWCGCGLTVGYQEVASFLQKKGYGGIFFAAEDKLASLLSTYLILFNRDSFLCLFKVP